MRRNAAGKRRDANEPAIIAALRAVGATVQQLSGADIPDLLVGFDGGNWLFEVKAAKGTLSIEQANWHLRWAGVVDVVRTPEEALELLGVKVRSKAV